MRKPKSTFKVDLDCTDGFKPANLCAAPKNSKTGINGVSLTKNGKYRATIVVDGVQKALGQFFSLTQAADARKHAEALFGLGPSELLRVIVSVHPDHVEALKQHVKLHLQEPFKPRDRSRFTPWDIAEIQRQFKSGQKKQVELASMYKCGQGTISSIVTKGTATHIPRRKPTRKPDEQSMSFL
jgi:hypothetical protein